MLLTVLLAGFRLPLLATKRFLSTASNLLILLSLLLTSFADSSLVHSLLYDIAHSYSTLFYQLFSSLLYFQHFLFFSHSFTQFSATLLLLQHFRFFSHSFTFLFFLLLEPSLLSKRPLFPVTPLLFNFFDFFDFFDDSLRCLSYLLKSLVYETSLLSHSFTSATTPLIGTLFTSITTSLLLSNHSLSTSSQPLLYLSTTPTLFLISPSTSLLALSTSYTLLFAFRFAFLGLHGASALGYLSATSFI